ncbi:MAG: NADH-quinone oxidoreductase subunit N, partial [Acidimicrobiia bacterium]
IPPLSGWFAKFVMFRAIIGGGSAASNVLAAIAAVNAVIALFYYAKVVKSVWMDATPAVAAGDRDGATAGSLALALGIAAVVTVAVGFYPDISSFFADATRVLVAKGG